MSWNTLNVEQETEASRDQIAAALPGDERRRRNGRKPAPGPRPPTVSFLWQVFGGTILSIVALVGLTAYGQLTSMVTDLRRDMNELEVNTLRKDEFNTRLGVLWISVKELQNSGISTVNQNEHAKALTQSLIQQLSVSEEQRKSLQRKVDELTQRVSAFAERLAAFEASQRAATR